MAAMKFYYNGQLLRTSKTHDYTHAVIREDEEGHYRLWGCASTYSGAAKALNEANRAYRGSLEFRIVELEKR